MNTKLIEETYLKKINQFVKYNKSYYLESNSIISDSDFDILKKEILQLEDQYNFLSNKKCCSAKIVVGAINPH